MVNQALKWFIRNSFTGRLKLFPLQMLFANDFPSQSFLVLLLCKWFSSFRGVPEAYVLNFQICSLVKLLTTGTTD